MAYIVLIKRVAKADKIDLFMEKYRAEQPKCDGFIAEYITRVDTDVEEPLKSLKIATAEGVTFVNVAFWENEKKFSKHFKPVVGYFDTETECAPRERLALEILGSSGSVSENLTQETTE